MHQVTFNWHIKTCAFLTVGFFGFALLSFAQQGKLEIELTDKNYDAWKNHIQPTSDELAWTKINWLPDLKSGITEATKTGKPILLWTMNGHPFGCT